MGVSACCTAGSVDNRRMAAYCAMVSLAYANQLPATVETVKALSSGNYLCQGYWILTLD